MLLMLPDSWSLALLSLASSTPFIRILARSSSPDSSAPSKDTSTSYSFLAIFSPPLPSLRQVPKLPDAPSVQSTIISPLFLLPLISHQSLRLR
ncbi:hypothetical protein DL95DRAFT_389960, partial [Leptodontidium sp. 2 PMI_412]